MNHVDHRYWTRNCHGFQVHNARGRRGIVQDVLFGAERDRPAALAVLGGVFGNRLELVPIEDVQTIEPRHRRLTVRDA